MYIVDFMGFVFLFVFLKIVFGICGEFSCFYFRFWSRVFIRVFSRGLVKVGGGFVFFVFVIDSLEILSR